MIINECPTFLECAHSDDFVSLMYYLGLISIQSSRYNMLNFSIPNYVIKELYRNFIFDFIKAQNNLSVDTVNVSKSFIEMAENKNIMPFLKPQDHAMRKSIIWLTLIAEFKEFIP